MIPIPHLSLHANAVVIGNIAVERLDIVAIPLRRYAKYTLKIGGDIQRKAVAGAQNKPNIEPLLCKRRLKKLARPVRVAPLV